MAKWYGKVGYAVTEETEPGLWESQIVEMDYYGDIIDDSWRRQNSGEINDDINLTVRISIVADPYANEKCSDIIYVDYRGTKWKVTNVVPQFPRLVLSVGGVYNE